MFEVTLEEVRGVTVARPRLARLDAHAAGEFRARLVPVATGKRELVVALDEVAFMDSTGLGALVSVLKALAPGGQVKLVGVGSAVASILRVTRLEQVFARFGSVDEALAS